MKKNQIKPDKKISYPAIIHSTSVNRILLLIVIQIYLSTAFSQQNQISITKEHVSLAEILLEIKMQSGKSILFNNDLINTYKNESINIKNADLEEALKQCLEGKNLKFRIVDDVIIIEPESEKSKKEITAEAIVQTIKGSVFDADSKIPLIGANIILLNTSPLFVTISDVDGNFRLKNVPVGRYNIKISYLGYQSYTAREVLVSSGKEIALNIGLRESVAEIEALEIKSYSNKSRPINSMATLSSRQLSMEEANRYAGAFDDPARLVTSQAGASFASVRSNGIVIRGNAPKGLLWRLEGIQIPNPSHFADFISLGGGGVTALSSQTMANSDFFTGAFPAEYGNAFSGVFDINMRIGNTEKREHTFQTGIVGIDFASEGPFIKGKRASYLFNYRYSTLGILTPVLPDEMGIIDWQDLSFKCNFPLKKLGVFTLWGIGALDKQLRLAEEDSSRWETKDDQKEYKARFSMGAIGFSHKIILGEKTYIHTSFAPTGNSFIWKQKRCNDNLILQPKTDFRDYKWKYTFASSINHKFSAIHNNKTGLIINSLHYNIDTKKAEEYGDTLQTFVSEHGKSRLLQFFTQSKYTLSNQMTINAGIHSQYFTLNRHHTLEPRLGIRWNFHAQHTIALAYGLHSQLENISLYLAQQHIGNEKILPNKDLDFSKSHHFVIEYEMKLSDNLIFKIEPFYQHLFNIPVVPGSYISTINIDDIWSFNDSLVNSGTGRNYGVDITLERYLNRGYYYLITTSLFESKYKGGDGNEYNTRFNRNYVFNIMGGKEWYVGKALNNIMGANIRFTYVGGDRIHPINYLASTEQQEIVEDLSRAYADQLPPAPILSLSFSYRMNKPSRSGIWSFQLINALAHKEFQEYEFNTESNTIEKVEDLIMIPNLSYKIEF